MTYWILNAVFLAAAVVVLVIALRSGPRPGRPGLKRRTLNRRALGVTALVLLTLTAVFDNIMISVGLVDYGDAQISGIRLGIMPIEDFAYTVFAVLALPALWTLLGPAAPADGTTAAPAGPADSARPTTAATDSPEDPIHDR